ncbi:DUF814 domain-containing protein [Candidatus Woesearchaeota archaeon]|nr:DUF814 domain-containing protein [Candidatus Woesearchaeota archaeon]
MLTITLDIRKSVEENAAAYFEKAKKARKKREGALKALAITQEKLKKIQEEKEVKTQSFAKTLEQQKQGNVLKKQEWYEKFRWFYSSEGFLCIGGRDATTNEIVIKKHTEKNDIVFHTDMAGSPFFVIKVKDEKPTEITLQEVADATATYSRAWRQGLASLNVFYVAPDQVSKQTKAGEYMGKGAFMIYGKTTYLHGSVKIAIGLDQNSQIIGGPVSAVQKQCKKIITLVPGREKASDAAKLIKKKIDGNLDDIVKVIPPGGCQIVKT